MDYNTKKWRLEFTKDRIDKPDGWLEIWEKNYCVCELPGEPTPKMVRDAHLIAAAPFLLAQAKRSMLLYEFFEKFAFYAVQNKAEGGFESLKTLREGKKYLENLIRMAEGK